MPSEGVAPSPARFELAASAGCARTASRTKNGLGESCTHNHPVKSRLLCCWELRTRSGSKTADPSGARTRFAGLKGQPPAHGRTGRDDAPGTCTPFGSLRDSCRTSWTSAPKVCECPRQDLHPGGSAQEAEASSARPRGRETRRWARTRAPTRCPSTESHRVLLLTRQAHHSSCFRGRKVRQGVAPCWSRLQLDASLHGSRTE